MGVTENSNIRNRKAILTSYLNERIYVFSFNKSLLRTSLYSFLSIVSFSKEKFYFKSTHSTHPRPTSYNDDTTKW